MQGGMTVEGEETYRKRYQSLSWPFVLLTLGNMFLVSPILLYNLSSYHPYMIEILSIMGMLVNTIGTVMLIVFVSKNLRNGYPKNLVLIIVAVILRWMVCEGLILMIFTVWSGAYAVGWFLILPYGVAQTSILPCLVAVVIDRNYRKKVEDQHVELGTISAQNKIERNFGQDEIGKIAEALKLGDIVAVPTETVYGLAVKGDDERAIKKIADLKERGADSGKVFTLMVAETEDIGKYAEMDDLAKTIVDRYFPGELTLVLPRRRDFEHPYFGKFEKIGIRVPKHRFMLDLLREAGPLVVTSANLKGGVPANTSREVCGLLADAVVEGESGGNPPSTVVEIVDNKIIVLRQGSLEIRI